MAPEAEEPAPKSSSNVTTGGPGPSAAQGDAVSFPLRTLSQGDAQGELLISSQALSFYGGMDLESGQVSEAGHPLEGVSLKDKVVVFPTGKGSTVGSYALYRLASNRLAPAALVLERAEPIVVTGAILAELPCVDGVEIASLEEAVEELKARRSAGGDNADSAPGRVWARLQGEVLEIFLAKRTP